MTQATQLMSKAARSKPKAFSNMAQSVKSAGFALSLSALALGCTRQNTPNPEAKPVKPSQGQPPASGDEGGIISSGLLPKLNDHADYATLPGGQLIPVTYFQGIPYLSIESTLSDRSYQNLSSDAAARKLDRDAIMNQALSSDLKVMQQSINLLQVKIIPSVGYMSFMMPYASYSSLSALKGLNHTLLVSPVVVDAASHIAVKKLSKTLNQDLADAGVATFSDAFSGLKRIGIEGFEKAMQADLPGVAVDGSGVKVGVTDTGVTFNHPALTDANGKSRVSYMKDFTNEGTVYFAPGASFGVRKPKKEEIAQGEKPEQILMLNAQFLGQGSAAKLPFADDLKEVKDFKILLNADLRDILLKKDSGARFAVLSETGFANKEGNEFVDINGNGKIEDDILAIYLPSATAGETGSVYLALGGDNDFRNAVPLRNFNTTKDTVAAYQEKFGMHISAKTLINNETDKAPVEVIGAAVVGYDPGNHGSHVSGIIGARKIIANDADSTYARGVAPSAELMVNRVCANLGGCNALEALIDLSMAGAEIINMSLGGLSPFNDGYGVQETIINRLTLQQNTLFVISAGNSGPGRQTIGSPSVARLSLSVGASASKSLIQRQYQWPGSTKSAQDPSKIDEDFMLFFSSRGPTAAAGYKPNIAAPGTELSSVQLNSAPGTRSGLDVYWGTSMAAPTAAGAAALLLDAAKKFNAKNPNDLLPVDALSLRSALMEGAQAFDVNKLNLKTGVSSKGKYTWIDQGAGLISLPGAWAKLKEMSKARAQASVVQVIVDKDGQKTSKPVALDYEVRVLRKMPNGLDYTGATAAATPAYLGLGRVSLVPKFGRGLWIDPTSKESLYEVQVARKLPLNLLQGADAGDLARLLNSTAETFELETEIYGSDSKWLKAGAIQTLDCNKSDLSDQLTIIGQGPTDSVNPDGTGTSVGLKASNLYVCVNTAALKALAPGDHGAIIKAFRKTKTGREAAAAFEVPVYLTKPHHTLEGSQKYQISGVANSFDVQRNYVVVPDGTTVVNVSLEVPELKADGSGCAGVELMAYEALNTAQPKELAPRPKAVASSCALTGAPGGNRKIGYSRFNPNPGVWDLHVFGRYQFEKSPYTLSVEYAKIASGVLKISGLPTALNGKFNFDVLETTFAIEPSAEKSAFSLDALVQTVRTTIKQKESLAVANADGVVFRSYDDTVNSVGFNTFGATGSDIDLEVQECEAAAADKCKPLVTSGTATDVETVVFVPKAGKFYRALVIGFEVSNGKDTEFTIQEQLNLKYADSGTLVISKDATQTQKFEVQHSFDLASGKLLQDERFKSGKFAAKGELIVRTQTGSEIVEIPVNVSAKDDASTVR
jgi:subtilisin family serine protease